MPFSTFPGNLRFAPPAKEESWTETKMTKTQPNACMQYPDEVFGNFSGSQMWNPNTPVSEDCLYLNVFAPKNIEGVGYYINIQRSILYKNDP